MAITDKFTKVSDGARAEPTTLSQARAVAAPTIYCDDLTTWADGEAVHFIIYIADADNKKIPGSQIDCKGIVSGDTITNVQYKAGVDAGNNIGAIVQASPTAAWADDLSEGLRNEHNPDGTHENVTATTVTTSGAVTVGNGLTVSSGTATVPNLSVSGTVTLPAGSVNYSSLNTPDGAIPRTDVEKPHFGRAYLATGGTSGGYIIIAMETAMPFDNLDPLSNGVTLFGSRLQVSRAGVYNINIQIAMSDGAPTNNLIVWLWHSAVGSSSANRIRHHDRPISAGLSQTYSHTITLAANDIVGIDVYAANNIRAASPVGTDAWSRANLGPYISVTEIR